MEAIFSAQPCAHLHAVSQRQLNYLFYQVLVMHIHFGDFLRSLLETKLMTNLAICFCEIN